MKAKAAAREEIGSPYTVFQARCNPLGLKHSVPKRASRVSCSSIQATEAMVSCSQPPALMRHSVFLQCRDYGKPGLTQGEIDGAIDEARERLV